MNTKQIKDIIEQHNDPARVKAHSTLMFVIYQNNRFLRFITNMTLKEVEEKYSKSKERIDIYRVSKNLKWVRSLESF